MNRQTFECARLTIDASPESVFKFWMDPELIEKWWGPEGFTTRVKAQDSTVGGSFSFEMTAPSGERCAMTGRYLRIVPPEVLEFEIYDHCNIGLPDGAEVQRNVSVVKVEFHRSGASTLVVVSQEGLNETYRPLAAAGWSESLAKMVTLPTVAATK